MFYDYRQNNSGGVFLAEHENGISVEVIIEADSADEANARAEQIGLYFDGCSDGRDCNCCGDRWYRAWDEGSPVPSVYGVPITEAETNGYADRVNGPEGYIHYADGRVESFWDREPVES